MRHTLQLRGLLNQWRTGLTALHLVVIRRFVVPVLIGSAIVVGVCPAQQSGPCAGEQWPCRDRVPGVPCFRAELLSLTAGCGISQDFCCLYIYATYRCRTQPFCDGDECRNTREVVVRIRITGVCERITEGTPGYRCTGGGFVRDGGGNSGGYRIILPAECGQPATDARLVPVVTVSAL